jgi:hypothetical protein
VASQRQEVSVPIDTETIDRLVAYINEKFRHDPEITPDLVAESIRGIQIHARLNLVERRA